jgi:hypothetical protein
MRIHQLARVCAVSLVLVAFSDAARAACTFGLSGEASRSVVFSSEAFGFLPSTPEGNPFFTRSSLNSDGADHSYAYRGEGQWFLLGAAPGTQFGHSDAILAARRRPPHLLA